MPGWNEAAWFSFLTGVALKSTLLLGVAWMLALLMRKKFRRGPAPAVDCRIGIRAGIAPTFGCTAGAASSGGDGASATVSARGYISDNGQRQSLFDNQRKRSPRSHSRVRAIDRASRLEAMADAVVGRGGGCGVLANARGV